MGINTKPEVWLRGPLPLIPSLLQPVAHALLQAQDEVNDLMNDFPEALLWQKVAGLASPGFHLQHLAGVLDRLFTYAAGGMLSAEQLQNLAGEGKNQEQGVHALLTAFNERIELCLQQLKAMDDTTLTAIRGVGRQQTPSTVIGLLVHSAEHTMRHTGQLLVTVKVLTAGSAS